MPLAVGSSHFLASADSVPLDHEGGNVSVVVIVCQLNRVRGRKRLISVTVDVVVAATEIEVTIDSRLCCQARGPWTRK